MAAATALVLAVAALVIVEPFGDTDDEPPDDREQAAEEPDPTPLPEPAVPHPPAPPPAGGECPEAPEVTEWDARFSDMVAFVEQERELAYDHPVPVMLVDDQTYLDCVGEGSSLGVYNGQTILVRGTELTPATRGTLVHELTHALDDQHFEILGSPAGPPEAHLAHLGLIEGNASRVERAYDTMQVGNGVSPSEVEDDPPPYEPPAEDGNGSGDEDEDEDATGDPGGTGTTGTTGPGPDATGPAGTGTTLGRREGLSRAGQAGGEPRRVTDESIAADLPGYQEALGLVPYDVAPLLVETLLSEGGNAAVDAAFSDPPRTAEHILDPRTYLDRESEVAVKTPAPLDAVGPVYEVSSVGAIDVYLLLAAGVGPEQALDAATGWGGDGAIAYRDGEGRRCVGLAVVGDTEGDTAELGDALASWAGSSVAADASHTVREEDGAQVLHACDLGSRPASHDLLDALMFAGARAFEATLALDEGLGGRDAFARADCVVDRLALPTVLSTYGVGGRPADGDIAEVEAARAGC